MRDRMNTKQVVLEVQAVAEIDKLVLKLEEQVTLHQ